MTVLVKVGSEGKYIDLMVDWSFKKIFGTEVNKDILIEFLKVIFPQYAISDITYVPTEQLGIMEDDRKAIFDVLSNEPSAFPAPAVRPANSRLDCSKFCAGFGLVLPDWRYHVNRMIAELAAQGNL